MSSNNIVIVNGRPASNPQPYKATAHLPVGTIIEFEGAKYRILKSNKVNYRVEDIHGAQYDLDKRSDITELVGDQTFTK